MCCLLKKKEYNQDSTYEIRFLCHCTVCGREFQYGDDASPMFTDDLWQWLCKHYGIDEDARAEAVGLKYLENLEDGHTYICAKCAEKALGRTLRLPDLNGSYFNKPFIMSYFGYNEVQADILRKALPVENKGNINSIHLVIRNRK